mmetsp:Transcript_17183/g.29272  ORF Transcript_17183/g.29272 Transcript_17183/m.29272 type:complete len:364 (-) Transcript_17183:75-1166(-)
MARAPRLWLEALSCRDRVTKPDGTPPRLRTAMKATARPSRHGDGVELGRPLAHGRRVAHHVARLGLEHLGREVDRAVLGLHLDHHAAHLLADRRDGGHVLDVDLAHLADVQQTVQPVRQGDHRAVRLDGGHHPVDEVARPELVQPPLQHVPPMRDDQPAARAVGLEQLDRQRHADQLAAPRRPVAQVPVAPWQKGWQPLDVHRGARWRDAQHCRAVRDVGLQELAYPPPRDRALHFGQRDGDARLPGAEDLALVHCARLELLEALAAIAGARGVRLQGDVLAAELRETVGANVHHVGAVGLFVPHDRALDDLPNRQVGLVHLRRAVEPGRLAHPHGGAASARKRVRASSMRGEGSERVRGQPR